MRRCIICGRPLKTGRKYCYLHKRGRAPARTPGELLSRNIKEQVKKQNKQTNRIAIQFIPILFICFGFIIVVQNFWPGVILILMGVLTIFFQIYSKNQKKKLKNSF